jgi:CheY-like chemotaxis protein
MFKILIIDPNDPFRQSLKKVLASRLPFTIIEAVAAGDEGLKMVETFDPQLIFLDIHLPTTSGLDVARQIKAHHPGIIIVILTSYNSPEYQEAAEDSGVEHLVPSWRILILMSIVTGTKINRESIPPNHRANIRVT